MTDLNINKPPAWFWVVAVLALLWNLFGVTMYLGQVLMSPEMMATRMTDAQVAAVQAQPAWYVAAFAIAVFAGALGSILLLMRRKWAFGAFAVSLLGVLVQQLYHFVLSDVAASFQASDMVIVTLIILVSAALLWLSKHADQKGWLR